MSYHQKPSRRKRDPQATSLIPNEAEDFELTRDCSVKEIEKLLPVFDEIPLKWPGYHFKIGKDPDNRSRNRYTNILPYDENRLNLCEADETDNDYINASPVRLFPTGSNGKNDRLIVCQGPLPQTVEHFWQMIYESNTRVIAMVAETRENGREKCARYWPEEDEPVLCERQRLIVRYEAVSRFYKDTKSEDVLYIIRRVILKRLPDGQEREIRQFHYKCWPDFGVPDDRDTFVEYANEVRKAAKNNPDGPLVVHCSAGVGRTGTFSLLLAGLALISRKEALQPLKICRDLRSQRMEMIETEDQFLFACLCLVDVMKRGKEKGKSTLITREESEDYWQINNKDES